MQAAVTAGNPGGEATRRSETRKDGVFEREGTDNGTTQSMGGGVGRHGHHARSRVALGATPARAAVAHVVQPGETLWSISAANNLTTRTVAAFNGIAEDAQVVAGTTIHVPTVEEGAAALAAAGHPRAGARHRHGRHRARRSPAAAGASRPGLRLLAAAAACRSIPAAAASWTRCARRR